MMKMTSGFSFYTFTHKGEQYTVEWEESDKILKLSYQKEGKEIGTNNIKLLGVINQATLDQLVKDYWNSFKKNKLNNS